MITVGRVLDHIKSRGEQGASYLEVADAIATTRRERSQVFEVMLDLAGRVVVPVDSATSTRVRMR